MNDTATTDAHSVDEFLGSETKPRWRRWMKYWLPAVVLLVLAAVFLRGGDDKQQYITEPVVERSLDIDVTATGNLRPTNQVEVGSEVSGRIDRMLVDVNDRVSRGQVLAQINTDVIEDQIRQAQANLNAARASVAQAGATLDVDTAQLARLQEVWRLSEGKVPSRTELEAAEANVKRDRASVASAQANVASAQAQLSSAMTNRDRAVIRSPVSGVVLARQVEPGQTVAASFNTPTLFVIAEDLSQMQLRVSIDEADVGQVEAGQKASFTVDAYPGRKFPATVERVDLASNNTAQSSQQQQSAGQQGNSVIIYEARLTVDNAAGLLRPGMTATANIATDSTGKRMLVPNGALAFRAAEKGQHGRSAAQQRQRLWARSREGAGDDRPRQPADGLCPPGQQRAEADRGRHRAERRALHGRFLEGPEDRDEGRDVDQGQGKVIGEAIIELEGITKTFGQGSAAFQALRGVDLTIARGDFVAIMGASGSGKSTTMNILGCLDTPTTGVYRFLGTEVQSLSRDQRSLLRRRYLGFVFQGFNLLARTSAAENVELPLIYRGEKKEARREAALRALDRVGLVPWADHTPAELSGGQQQRVAIARALVTDPEVLLADEPTGNLDSERSLEIMEFLGELNKTGITILMVTHEPEMAEFAKTIVHFKDGLVERIEQGHRQGAPLGAA